MIWWLSAIGLVLAMALCSVAHLGLRTRSVVSVADCFERTGRQEQLKWLIHARDRLGLATAALRTLASLALVLVLVNLCERYGLTTAQRNVVAFGAAFVVILLFGVTVPTAIAKYAAGPVIAGLLPALRVLHVLFVPLARVLDVVDGVIRRLSGVPERTSAAQADDLEREILGMISEGEIQGAVDEHEKEMIESVIGFSDTDASEIMTPRTEIDAIAEGASLKEIKSLITESGHSRIPVYRDSIDDILGVLYAKDLISLGDENNFDLAGILRDVPFIPDSKPVTELLQEFKDQKVHMAIVLDEYGGTSGLVTIEDIVEELVGEIEDEYEPPEPEPITRIDEQTVEVDARVRVDDLNEELKISLPEHDDYETLGGFIFSSMGRIPQVGETCEHGNVRIRILDAEPRRVNRLRIQITPETSTSNGNNHPT